MKIPLPFLSVSDSAKVKPAGRPQIIPPTTRLPEPESNTFKGFFMRAYARLIEKIDKKNPWYRGSLPYSLLMLIGLRWRLRENNLYDTHLPGALSKAPDGGFKASYLTNRTADGTYNDLENPMMGSAKSRFGHNVPLEYAFPDSEPAIMTPNPREVSLRLMTRDTFQPATTLNMLAAAWIQFMIKGWFSHGSNQKENPWKIALPQGDNWYENPMTILRTADDPTRTPEEAGLPPTHLNVESHWWDGSQIYGSSPEMQKFVRSGIDGKLKIGEDGLLHIPPNAPVQPSSVPGWWLGLSMMITTFTLEHNSICDRLKAEYPHWTDEELFQRARLVNAALMAKIHTVEWTPALLANPALQIGMRANWWGLVEEKIYRMFGRISQSELISGIPGSPKDHFGVPFGLTEEFVAVYKMHPLIPDEYSFRSAADDSVIQELPFDRITGPQVDPLEEQLGMANIFYTFGTSHPGAITLHNYPRHLQTFERPDGRLMDLAAHDIMRTRELGVPRYNKFRELIQLPRINSFEEMTANPAWQAELREVYQNDVDKVDLIVGMFAETPPPGFAFSDTAFRIFILMASRRLNSDRFFTTDYNVETYSRAGMDWIDNNDMFSVLLRHYPSLRPALRGVKNAFAPWNRVS
ncbi:MAG TPA: peroxidase family protein [Chloroflexia bacterium]|nr:peroxidase family protein [Chloroflexia bacterium]